MRLRAIPAQGGPIPALPANSRKQSLFELKSAMYAQNGVITTPGFLRLEVNLGTTQTNSIRFATTENQQTGGGAQNPTERRLKISDSFTVMNWGFYVGIAANASPSASDIGSQLLHTFPNNKVMTAAQATEFQKLYNGYLTLRVDSTVFIDSYPMLNFYRVGTSQQGVAVSTQATTGVLGRDEWNEPAYGSNNITPSVELNGQGAIDLSITTPGTFNPALSSQAAIAVLILQGFLHQGAATVQRQVNQSLKQQQNARPGGMKFNLR